MSVWCAENLDVGAMLEAYGHRVVEGVLWLGHTIYTQLANDARCRDTGRVPLKAEYLRRCIGRHHLDAVRQAAVEVGYVGRDESYRAGQVSQSYWILPPYDCARLVRRKITDSGLQHNLRRWRGDRQQKMWQRIRRNETPVSEAVCMHLWRNLQRVRIDADACACPSYGSAGGGCVHPAHQIAIEQIQNGELWLTVDDYGRLHTNMTNLPRTLRPHLSVEGKRLENVDISESQPLFMGLALACAESGGRQAKGTTADGGGDGSGTEYHMMDNTMMDKNTLLEGSFDRRRLSADLRRYLELCEARALYQTAADRLGKTRDEAKRAVMVVFFGRPWHRTTASAVLDELFPSVMQAMRQVKHHDYCRLAHLAQRIESAFMFGRVVPRIMQMWPDLFVSTIHDSILTTSGDAHLVRQVMLDEFARLGVAPQVKIEAC